MTARGTFAALVLASLFALPSLASATIVPKWNNAGGTAYRVISQGGDINLDGVYELITGEAPSSGTEKIGLRSGATGALLKQSALAYAWNGLWIQDLDGDGNAELILWEVGGKFTCLHYAPGAPTLEVRWSFTLPVQSFDWTFVDFDGNAKPYLVFKDNASNNYWVYNNAGVQVTTFNLSGGPTGAGWTTYLYVSDYDYDNRWELLIDYHNSLSAGSDILYMYENNAPVAVEPGVTMPFTVELGASYPNPTFRLSRVEYSLPHNGPATLRLFDLSGRVVRTLVDGSLTAGRHVATWDGQDSQGRQVPAGAYFYELKAAGQRQTRQVVRLH